ncbi:MAG TPA: hypothetical protein VG328_22620 [Stellaceae bacterium]|jgi:hypothetical protein|nr:hypothetical protein [Stellaceae bacterium]
MADEIAIREERDALRERIPGQFNAGLNAALKREPFRSEHVPYAKRGFSD